MDLNNLNEKMRELQQAWIDATNAIDAMMDLVPQEWQRGVEQEITQMKSSYIFNRPEDGTPDENPNGALFCDVKVRFENNHSVLYLVLKETYGEVEFYPNGLRVYRDGKEIGVGLPEPLFSLMHHEYRARAVDLFLTYAPNCLRSMQDTIARCTTLHIKHAIGNEAFSLFQKALSLQYALHEVYYNRFAPLNNFFIKAHMELSLIVEKIRATKGITKSNTIAGIRRSLEDLAASIPTPKLIDVPTYIKF